MQRWMRFVVGGLMLGLVLAASPALAQITTGTVTGNVKDAQGGIIPGATVVLISETRGTKSTPASTDETGNFVFPIVTATTQHEHRDGAEAAYKYVPHSRVVVAADGGFQHVLMQKPPRNRQHKRKSDRHDPHCFPQGQVGKNDCVLRLGRYEHVPPL